mmetsp:Transcript_10334/g.19603  ORF Transcript_10334/g.19603 Transcript_10334/m.19603 type:complete len:91 (+) Transcript_10334:419-691(+)
MDPSIITTPHKGIPTILKWVGELFLLRLRCFGPTARVLLPAILLLMLRKPTRSTAHCLTMRRPHTTKKQEGMGDWNASSGTYQRLPACAH